MSSYDPSAISMILLYLFSLSVCVCMCGGVCVCQGTVVRIRGQFVGSGDQAQVIRLGGKCFALLSDLISPQSRFL